MVTPVLWIVGVVALAFVVLVPGGVLLGTFRAARSGESVLAGGWRGLLRGLVAFVVAIAGLIALGTILGFAWVAYSFLHVYVLNPS